MSQPVSQNPWSYSLSRSNFGSNLPLGEGQKLELLHGSQPHPPPDATLKAIKQGDPRKRLKV